MAALGLLNLAQVLFRSGSSLQRTRRPDFWAPRLERIADDGLGDDSPGMAIPICTSDVPRGLRSSLGTASANRSPPTI